MKELTIEEKAKAYDEALKVLHKYDGANIMFSQSLKEEMFPELAESEDERIRKEILSFLREGKPYYCPNSIKRQEWAAWLEKQGEQKLPIEKLPSETKTIGKSLGFTTQEDCDRYNQMVSDLIMSDDDKGEQKLVDKAEPKFKVGDWIVCCDYEPVQIISIRTNAYYEMSNGDIRPFHMIDNNHNIRLWTIEDAKDGDILHSPSHHLIWIYKDNEHYHACVNMNYVTRNVTTNGLIAIENDACPATKDEQTILFAKMKENGYEWDEKHKQVKIL